jgi:hypothetical protein
MKSRCLSILLIKGVGGHPPISAVGSASTLQIRSQPYSPLFSACRSRRPEHDSSTARPGGPPPPSPPSTTLPGPPPPSPPSMTLPGPPRAPVLRRPYLLIWQPTPPTLAKKAKPASSHLVSWDLSSRLLRGDRLDFFTSLTNLYSLFRRSEVFRWN